MPELPEVETIVNDLKKELPGSIIRQFVLLNQKAGLKSSVINHGINDFTKLVVGKKIISVKRRAKQIVLELECGVIVIHLKMTGQIIYENKKSKIIVGGHPILGAGKAMPNKFTRARFELGDGSNMYFNDVRRFGWIRFFTNEQWMIESDKSGLEPLEKEFTLKAFVQILNKRNKSPIKQVIMDSKYLVGVGNIYADESLFASNIKPQRMVSTLTESEIKALWKNIPKILKLSIKNRGTSFNDYVDARGVKGNFVKLLKVYGRAGQACKVCDGILQKTRVGGRGTVWCENCQK